jgi:hypothetical protein
MQWATAATSAASRKVRSQVVIKETSTFEFATTALAAEVSFYVKGGGLGSCATTNEDNATAHTNKATSLLTIASPE